MCRSGQCKGSEAPKRGHSNHAGRRAAAAGLEPRAIGRQRGLESLFGGEFLQGLEMSASPVFDGWLTAQRRRLRACHAALLEQLDDHLLHSLIVLNDEGFQANPPTGAAVPCRIPTPGTEGPG